MSDVRFPASGKLELWVRDTGTLEGFTVYLDGKKVKDVFTDKIRKFPLTRPKDGAFSVIALKFGGADGGTSAIVDVTKPDEPDVLAQQKGLSHVYEVT